jgi:hypothetical protein
LLDAKSQNVLLAVSIKRQRYVDGFVLDQPFVANFDA